MKDIENVIMYYINTMNSKIERKAQTQEFLILYAKVYECRNIALKRGTSEQVQFLEQILNNIERHIKDIQGYSPLFYFYSN